MSHTTKIPAWQDAELDALRTAVQANMSPKRFVHTAAVEQMVIRLAALYCPEDTATLRAAALLHDITKEYDVADQIALCRQYCIPMTPGDEFAYKTFHAKTATAVIPERYPAFATEEVLSAVRWHTTGRMGMTLGEKLIYLADYIDDSRLFPDCVRLRAYFWNARPERMSAEARADHLRDTLIMSFDMTIRALVNEGAVISADTALARNDLVLDRLKKESRNR